MATQILPIRERRNWGATLGTFIFIVYNRGILQTRAGGCKFLLKSKAVKSEAGPNQVTSHLMQQLPGKDLR